MEQILRGKFSILKILELLFRLNQYDMQDPVLKFQLLEWVDLQQLWRQGCVDHKFLGNPGMWNAIMLDMRYSGWELEITLHSYIINVINQILTNQG